MGRPTKLTDEVQDAYVKGLKTGSPPEAAARRAGFAPASLYRWLKGSSPEQLAFQEAHEQALAEVESRLAMTLFRAALDQPRWALELLTRRYPARWGRPQAIVVDDGFTDRGPAEGMVVLSPELVETLVPRLLAAGRAGSGHPTTESVDIDAFEDDGLDDVPEAPDVDSATEAPES